MIARAMRRALDREAAKLQLPLPVPFADSAGTGTLSVRVGTEFELLPDLINSTGLAAAPATEDGRFLVPRILGEGV